MVNYEPNLDKAESIDTKISNDASQASFYIVILTFTAREVLIQINTSPQTDLPRFGGFISDYS